MTPDTRISDDRPRLVHAPTARHVVALVALVVGCAGDDGDVELVEGSLRVEFVLDTSTDFADYSDGYELSLEIDGPNDVDVATLPSGERSVVLDRVVAVGDYDLVAGLRPCETDDDPCGPRTDRCSASLAITADEPTVVEVLYQPGRECTVTTG